MDFCIIFTHHLLLKMTGILELQKTIGRVGNSLISNTLDMYEKRRIQGTLGNYVWIQKANMLGILIGKALKMKSLSRQSDSSLLKMLIC